MMLSRRPHSLTGVWLLLLLLWGCRGGDGAAETGDSKGGGDGTAPTSSGTYLVGTGIYDM